MNVLQVLIPVLLGLALVGYLIYETKQHSKKKAEENAAKRAYYKLQRTIDSEMA